MKAILFLLCCFPYLGFNFLSVDTQPSALIFSFICLLYLGGKSRLLRHKAMLYFFLAIVIAILYFVIEYAFVQASNISYALTSLTYYISTPIIAYAVYNVGIPEKIPKMLRNVILIWLLGSIIQYVAPDVISALVNHTRTSDSRGFTSFAPEPVWYGRVMLLLIILVVIVKNLNLFTKKLYISLLLICSFQIVALSLSGTTFFYLMVILLIYAFISVKSLQKKVLLTSAVGGCLILTVYFGLTYFGDKRVFILLNQALTDPGQLTKYGGFTMRILNGPMAVYIGLIENNGLGQGFFLSETSVVSFQIGDQIVDKENTGTLNGGYIFFVYQIGLFALIWYKGLFTALKSGNLIANKMKLFAIISLIVIVGFESSLSNPLSAYIVGVLMIKSNDKKTKKNILYGY